MPGKWDLLIAEAETILEGERCQQCGRPRYICQSDDADIDFRVYDETCNAMRKKEQREAQRSDKEKEKRKGVIVGIEAFTHSGTPLVEFREPYYKDQSKRTAAIEAERPVIPRDAPPGATPQAE